MSQTFAESRYKDKNTQGVKAYDANKQSRQNPGRTAGDKAYKEGSISMDIANEEHTKKAADKSPRKAHPAVYAETVMGIIPKTEAGYGFQQICRQIFA